MKVCRGCFFVVSLSLGLSFALAAPAAASLYCESYLQLPKDSSVAVPANLPALFWRLRNNHQKEGSTPELHTVDGKSTEVEVTSVEDYRLFLITPQTPLQPNQQYTLTAGCLGSKNPTTVSFLTAPVAPFPTTLGIASASKVSVSDEIVSPDGVTDEDLKVAKVSISLELSDDAEPWKGVLRYETLVDGKLGGTFVSWTHHMARYQALPGSRPDLEADKYGWSVGWPVVATDCDHQGDQYGTIAPGKHTVTIRAFLPGTDIVLETEPIEVNLTCDEAAKVQDKDKDTETDTDTDTDSEVVDDGDISMTRTGCSLTNDVTVTVDGLSLLGMLTLLLFVRRKRR